MTLLLRIILFLTLACVCGGCTQVRQAVKPPLTTDGELYLYAEAFPQDALRLDFTVESMAAIREDGVSIPLTLEYRHFSPAEAKRQRLFARGVVPPGRYSALAVTVKEASLMGEEGKGKLLVPDKAFENRTNFTVRSGKAAVVTLDLNYREALAGRISFRPVFSAQIPPLPLLELTGYLTNRGDNTITVFDRRSARIGAMIETGRGPAGIALDQVRQKAYVALSGEDALVVLDVKENDITDRIRLLAGDEPHYVVLTPDGKLALTANKGSNTVSIVDIQAQIELARIPVGVGPEYLLMDRTGRRAFVFNRLSGTISIIDINRRLVSATLATESGPLYGQFNRQGNQLYVFHEMSPYLLVYSLDTLSVVKRINAGSGISALKTNALTDRLYLGTRFGGTIDIYDPFSLMAIDFLLLDGGVGYLTIDGEENNLLVLQPEAKMVRMINLISKRERGVIDTGSDPYSAVVFGER